MSSHLRIKKICEHCGEVFIAQKTVTKFCSLTCARRNYKLREKKERVQKVESETNIQLLSKSRLVDTPASKPLGDLIDIKALSSLTSISERTLFRLIKDEDFPKLKVGRSLLFHRQTVIDYLTTKYGNI
ncbi:helix-turn-helix transcriptional regulator [Chitinophaga sp. 30R24]|uniref:helix-turn-helix transcriptional regulator n=1 Tax=Chitinophaga sp. 30R24 TaxID=3248838 RepID=UPI003B8FEE29